MPAKPRNPEIIPPRRTLLGKQVGRTLRVRGTFVRKGSRSAKGRIYPTVLIRNIRETDSGELLADHLWFNCGNVWKTARLQPGDIVEFWARSIEYRTG